PRAWPTLFRVPRRYLGRRAGVQGRPRVRTHTAASSSLSPALAGGMRAVEVGVAAAVVSENLTGRLSNDVGRPQHDLVSNTLTIRPALCTVPAHYVPGLRRGIGSSGQPVRQPHDIQRPPPAEGRPRARP